MTGGRVLVYVQHLLGTGHLKRAALLADALTRCGHMVTLVSGGLPVGLTVNASRFVQLPPVGAADMRFKSLVDARGLPVDAAFKQARRDMLLELWRETEPQLLLIELFPFGRRQMRFELLPLLDAARLAAHPPVVVSSVRDVLGGGQSDPSRQQRMLELFDRYFDHLLVHGDPALVPFERTFAHVRELGARLHYTGYVVQRPPGNAPSGAGTVGNDEVIVSAGGGAVGRPLLEAAIRARPLSCLSGLRWRILVGAGLGDAALGELAVLARQVNGEGALVERNRADFPAMLRHCRLSVSQAGYNTVMETLQAGVRSVMVPFAGAAETEQTVRARVLVERGWIDMLEEPAMTPATLAQAIDRAAARAPLAPGVLMADGADRSAQLVTRWLAQGAA